MTDRIRDAAEKWWDENVMSSDVSWREAKKNLSEFTRAEVKREQDRCIGLINYYSVSQQMHTVLINRIRKGGA